MGYKKDIFAFLRMNLNPCINHGESRVYHQLRKRLYIINAKHCISSSRQKYTPEGVMRYKGGNAALGDIHADA